MIICKKECLFLIQQLYYICMLLPEITKTVRDRVACREINKLEVICPFNCGAGTSDENKLLIKTLEVSVFSKI